MLYNSFLIKMDGSSSVKKDVSEIVGSKKRKKYNLWDASSVTRWQDGVLNFGHFQQ